ncbi:MAG: hypothetical protein JWN70_1024 [Planctomycetaceae bacterium]|nr:hypothetical protein [Planctomycetaceae bacterium]
MWNTLVRECSGRGATMLIGMFMGTLVTALLAWLKRRHERHSIMTGDARDTVVIAQHVIESVEVVSADGSHVIRRPVRVRVRALGQSELERVVPNGHLAHELLKRAQQVSTRHTLISMDGAEGSYLLESLTNFVCDRVANAPFKHDLYIMAPCCEPAGLVVHQPITILLVRQEDLTLFEDWAVCRDTEVEHGADGTRILSLMELSKRFREEEAKLAELRKTGQRTRYMETMYLLDLALDSRVAPIDTKPVPWDRFQSVLKEMHVE